MTGPADYLTGACRALGDAVDRVTADTTADTLAHIAAAHADIDQALTLRQLRDLIVAAEEPDGGR